MYKINTYTLDDFFYIDIKDSEYGEEATAAIVDMLSGRAVRLIPKACDEDPRIRVEIKAAVARAQKTHPYSVNLLEAHIRSLIKRLMMEPVDVRNLLSIDGLDENDMKFFGFEPDKHPYSITELEWLLKSVVEHSFDSANAEDAEEILRSYGFEDDDMEFFGFNEYAERDGDNSINDDGCECCERDRNGGCNDGGDKPESGIAAFNPTSTIRFDLPFIAADDTGTYIRYGKHIYRYITGDGITEVSSDSVSPEITARAKELLTRLVHFEAVCTYIPWTVFRVKTHNPNKIKYYVADYTEDFIREVRLVKAVPSDAPSVKDMNPVDFGGDYDGKTDDEKYYVSFELVPQKYEQTIRIGRTDLERYQKLLTEEPADAGVCLGEDNTITWTAKFENGMEMDLKICGVRYLEGESNLPWTEAVLFRDGCEVSCSDASDTLEGDWVCPDLNGDTYIMHVVAADF